MRKMTKATWCVLVALSALLTGCGGVEIRQITKANPYVKGLRFYRPRPYLWVTKAKDKSNDLQATIIYLPDKSQEYVASVWSGLGKVDAKFTLENGWNLTGLNETRESQTAEIITALAGPLKAASNILKEPTEGGLRPGLYVLIFDDQTGLVSNVKPVVLFE